MKTNNTVLAIIGMVLLVAHAVTIADDIQAVLEDPNQDNKPGEILKLAFDLGRYLKQGQPGEQPRKNAFMDGQPFAVKATYESRLSSLSLSRKQRDI